MLTNELTYRCRHRCWAPCPCWWTWCWGRSRRESRRTWQTRGESTAEVQRCSTDQAVAVLVVLVIVWSPRTALGGRPARVEDQQRRHRQPSHILTHNHRPTFWGQWFSLFVSDLNYWKMLRATPMEMAMNSVVLYDLWLTAGSGKNIPHL